MLHIEGFDQRLHHCFQAGEKRMNNFCGSCLRSMQRPGRLVSNKMKASYISEHPSLSGLSMLDESNTDSDGVRPRQHQM